MYKRNIHSNLVSNIETKIIKVDDISELNNKIGLYFKEIREARGISQYDLGISIGLSEDTAQQQIYKYEKGIIRIPIDNAIKIAKALNIDLIINGDEIILLPQ